MLRIKDTNTTPRPEGWRYPATDDTEITASSWMNLKREVAAHYRSNGKPLPTEQDLIDYLCRNVSVHCYDGHDEFRNRFTDPLPNLMGGKGQRWPVILWPFKLLAEPGDSGLGDIVARNIGPIGGDAFKKWHFKLFGRDCGCGARQASLNEMYPL